MQIKPHQIPHFARQRERFKSAISDCQFTSYTLVGSMWSKINDFEKDFSKAKFMIKPFAYVKIKDGNTIIERVN